MPDFLTIPVLWFAAGLLFIGLEMVLPTGAFLFVGLGCLAGWLAALLEASVAFQFGGFCVVALLALCVLRSRMRRVFSGESTAAAQVGSLSGAQGTVTVAIEPGLEGQVEVGGSFWRAMCPDGLSARAGERVRVEAVSPADALLLVVRPAGSHGA